MIHSIIKNTSRNTTRFWRWTTFTVLLLILTVQTFAGQALKRFPDIYGDKIVFVSEEDIWIASATGGMAERLTIHDGSERYPKFSPDGSLIAFTGEYDGNADVYVMDTHGGHITRVTFHPGYDQVVGWHPTKNKIIFTSNRDSYSRFSRLYLINPDGTGLERLILNEAVQGSFSPDGKKIAYNKVSRENRTWKRYKGGTAQEVYVYDFISHQEKNITNFRGTDRIPMWIGKRIYFSSDRDGRLNLYYYDTQTGAIRQVTRHQRFDVRRPSAGDSQIVYELAGEIRVLDTNTGKNHLVPIEIAGDAPETRPYLKKVEKFVTGFDVSPSGKRALVVARGEVFSVPAKEGVTLNLTATPGAREKDAVWSPDGEKIACISDRDGEYQLYVQDADRVTKPKQLTHFKTGYRHTLRWSPDSKRIAFTDQTLTLYYVDVNGGQPVRVDKADFENVDVSVDLKPIYDFAWSPDSRYLAYSKMDSTLVNKLYVYSLDEKRVRCVSEGLFNDFHPVFTKDGQHLLFISNRRFDPTYGDFEWEMVYKKMAGIYALTLRKDGAPLLPPRNDREVESKEAKKSQKQKVRVSIDFDGLTSRIESLPVKRGNYRYLAVSDDHLFYLNRDEGDFNRFEFRSHLPMDLYAFSFKDRQEELVLKGIDEYKLSADGSHIAYRKGKKIGIIKSSVRDAKKKYLDLSHLQMWMVPKAEWRQIFNEAWRIERDFYYEPNMHGIDWNAVREKYGQLVEKATCRQDLRFIIGEMIGELNTSHTYVFGGDFKRKAERVNVGLLAADYSVDKTSNRYRFAKIYSVPDWLKPNVPPLFGPGKNVQPGDYLLRVNGKEVTADRNIYSYFLGLANRKVLLTVNRKPSLKGAREIVVTPVSNEYQYRYLDWVEHNRRVVEKASHGLIGYLHLPDTYNRSARIFPKYYYSQTKKKGIIVDGRFNGGGLDPDIFLQRLNKKPLSYWTRRYSHDYMTPWLGNNAHLVCLTNRQAGSGGDELPYLFRKKKMGLVIGTRSWGGLVGISMFYPLIDGGGITAPDYRIYDEHGRWVVENEGVTPDIVIDNKPDEMARGYDAQLMKAVEVLMEQIKKDPRPWPKHQPFPVDEIKE